MHVLDGVNIDYDSTLLIYNGVDTREYANIIKELIDICRTTDYNMEKSIKNIEEFVSDLEEGDRVVIEVYNEEN